MPVKHDAVAERGMATLADGFTQIACDYPDETAVVSDGHSVTYAELDARVEHLAEALRAHGVAPETPVAALLPAGVATITVALASWRAGGAYLPLDPAAPDGRLAFLLSDARPPVVVTVGGLGPRARRYGRRVIEVQPDGTCPAWPHRETPPGGPPAAIPPHRLAYIIYTSGTTGRPKGVLVEHGSLAAMALTHEAVLYRDLPAAGGRVAVNNPVTTDSFFSEFAHLGFGRTLYVVPDAERRDPERMAGFLSRHAIDVLDATPTQIRALLLAGGRHVLDGLRILILGGEAIDAPLWSDLRSLARVRSFNLYGPTECTVDVAAAALADSATPVIGQAWPGCEILLLDDKLRPVPDGSVGEICVAGAHLARGYLHPTPAERARFTRIRLPGRERPVRAYRTGDRGRRNTAGVLEFLGRADEQVKIRGYRVELAEVETALRECPGVSDARVAFDQASSANPLRAWVVPEPSVDLGAIRRAVAEILPGHMVPALVPVTSIPMAATGKADMRRLMTLPVRHDDSGADGCAGEDAGLESLWCQVLGVATVAAGDDFFELGGDSLAATRITLLARNATGRRIPVRLIFDHPTFRDYCSAVRGCAR